MKKDSLITRLDGLFNNLVEEVSKVEPVEGEPLITFTERLKVFEAGVKWAATKNRLDEEDSGDTFSKLRSRSTGRSRRGSAAPAGPPKGAAS